MVCQYDFFVEIFENLIFDRNQRKSTVSRVTSNTKGLSGIGSGIANISPRKDLSAGAHAGLTLSGKGHGGKGTRPGERPNSGRNPSMNQKGGALTNPNDPMGVLLQNRGLQNPGSSQKGTGKGIGSTSTNSRPNITGVASKLKPPGSSGILKSSGSSSIVRQSPSKKRTPNSNQSGYANTESSTATDYGNASRGKEGKGSNLGRLAAGVNGAYLSEDQMKEQRTMAERSWRSKLPNATKAEKTMAKEDGSSSSSGQRGSELEAQKALSNQKMLADIASSGINPHPTQEDFVNAIGKEKITLKTTFDDAPLLQKPVNPSSLFEAVYSFVIFVSTMTRSL